MESARRLASKLLQLARPDQEVRVSARDSSYLEIGYLATAIVGPDRTNRDLPTDETEVDVTITFATHKGSPEKLSSRLLTGLIQQAGMVFP